MARARDPRGLEHAAGRQLGLRLRVDPRDRAVVEEEELPPVLRLNRLPDTAMSNRLIYSFFNIL